MRLITIPRKNWHVQFFHLFAEKGSSQPRVSGLPLNLLTLMLRGLGSVDISAQPNQCADETQESEIVL